MNVICPRNDAVILDKALAFVTDNIFQKKGSVEQQEVLLELRAKVIRVVEDSRVPEVLAFDIFQAVRTFDLIHFILEEICERNDLICPFVYVVKLAILGTTLKYGISSRAG